MLAGYKTYLTAAASIAVAWLSVYLGKMDAQTAVQMTSAAALSAALRHGIAPSTSTPSALLAPFLLAPFLFFGLDACATFSSPTAQRLAGIACVIDGLAQPIALPFISGIPTVGGVAASADAALVHPLVQQACTALAASLGTGPAKPVVTPPTS